MKNSSIIFTALLLIGPAPNLAATPTQERVVGRTYDIAEPDSITEMKKHAAKVDMRRHQEEKREIVKRFQPKNISLLPRAREGRSYLVDMTYTLDRNIPNGKGGILYPKGYKFNPLEYITYHSILVVINPEDKAQVQWFEKSSYANDFRVKLLLAGGSWYKAAKRLKRDVFYLIDPITTRFHLENAPCVISQKGAMMEVKEIDVTNGKK